MTSWFRLTNEVRDALTRLPVWTTTEDRQRALAYTDNHFEGTYEAIKAVQAGRPAPTHLGVLIAVARYEDAGWMPDGCFERWRRQVFRGIDHLSTAALIQWLSDREAALRRELLSLEDRLTNQWLQQEERVADAQVSAQGARQQLHEHFRDLILARLSIRDIPGAHEIVQRMPPGSLRDKIAHFHHERSELLEEVPDALHHEKDRHASPSSENALHPGQPLLELSAEVLRGLQLVRRHLDEGGHDWREGTARSDVQAASAWLDRQIRGGK